MTPTIVSYQVMPDEGITMEIGLNDTGDAIIKLHGATQINCWCGGTHLYKVQAELKGDTRMETLDMNDLEGCLHGDHRAATRFGYRLVHLMFFKERPPCDR